MEKSCNTCFAKKICNAFADFNGDKTPCVFYKNENLVKEIACVCKDCVYVESLRVRSLGVFKVNWFCIRNRKNPVLVDSDGFCSYGVKKASCTASRDDR